MRTDWVNSKLGNVATYLNGYAFKPSDWTDSGLPIIRIQNLNDPNAEFNYCAKEIPSKYIVNDGDILISWSASLGVYEWNRGKALLNQHIFKVIFDKIDINKHYLRYSVSARLADMERHAHGSTMRHIIKGEFDKTPILIPPVLEQKAIVAFLDDKTSKIDECVRLLDLQRKDLQKYRISIIAEAITHGLNPNVSYKETKVQWIGQIPSTWNVRPLKYVGESRNGLTYSPKDIVDNGILVLRSSNIQDSKLAFEDNVYVTKAPDMLRMLKGDILICSRNGSLALVGKCAYIPEDMDAVFGAFMMRFRPYEPNRFMYYVVQEAIRNYKAHYSTSTVNQLTVDVFGNMQIPIPPLTEQQAIADYLDSKTAKIDEAIKRIDEQITDLRAYRSALISDVVTGKIDVRNN